jgi:hypothetical protein
MKSNQSTQSITVKDIEQIEKRFKRMTMEGGKQVFSRRDWFSIFYRTNFENKKFTAQAQQKWEAIVNNPQLLPEHLFITTKQTN